MSDEPPPRRQSFLMISMHVWDQWDAPEIKCKWVLIYRKWFKAHPHHFSENCRLSIVNHRKDFRAVAIKYSVRRWLNPGALGTQEHFSFSSPTCMRPLWFPVHRSSEYTYCNRRTCACMHIHTKNTWCICFLRSQNFHPSASHSKYCTPCLTFLWEFFIYFSLWVPYEGQASSDSQRSSQYDVLHFHWPGY